MNSKITKNDWVKCSNNAAGFCNALASKIGNAIKRKGNFEAAAAHAGYQASIPPFTGIFNSILKSQKNTLKGKGEKIIADFLSNKTYDMNKCVDVIKQIKELYKNDVRDYTYGNAQKWVNMSFKYYVIFNAVDFNKRRGDRDEGTVLLSTHIKTVEPSPCVPQKMYVPKWPKWLCVCVLISYTKTYPKTIRLQVLCLFYNIFLRFEEIFQPILGPFFSLLD